jgi:hypothetical protein
MLSHIKQGLRNDASDMFCLVASPFRGVVDGCVSLQHSVCGREGESQRVEECDVRWLMADGEVLESGIGIGRRCWHRADQ